MTSDNLDYVVDEVCALLRYGLLGGAGAAYTPRTPLVLDEVLRQGCAPGAQSAPRVFALVRDAVLDVLDSVDRLAASRRLSAAHVGRLLRVLAVLVPRIPVAGGSSADMRPAAVEGGELLSLVRGSIARFRGSLEELEVAAEGGHWPGESPGEAEAGDEGDEEAEDPGAGLVLVAL